MTLTPEMRAKISEMAKEEAMWRIQNEGPEREYLRGLCEKSFISGATSVAEDAMELAEALKAWNRFEDCMNEFGEAQYCGEYAQIAHDKTHAALEKFEKKWGGR